MPNYPAFPAYNPYPAYPNNSYQQQYSQTVPQYTAPVPNYQQAAAQGGMVWVDGEVGAKAQQLPPGWDTSKPFPMWDTNDQVIYIKSFNAMGMPNPLTKLRYTIEEPTKQAPMMSSQAALPNSEPHSMQDMSQYARKDDLEQVKADLMAAMAATQAELKGAKGNGKSSV